MITLLKKNDLERPLLTVFRFASFCVSSFFFMKDSYINHIGSKLFLVACVAIVSIILDRLYASHQKDPRIIRVFLIEVCFSTLILLQTGGIGSPYKWYSFNIIGKAMQLVAYYNRWKIDKTKDLHDANNELEAANTKIKETIGLNIQAYNQADFTINNERLFNITFNLYELIGKIDSMNEKKIKAEVSFIKSSIEEALEDLHRWEKQKQIIN